MIEGHPGSDVREDGPWDGAWAIARVVCACVHNWSKGLGDGSLLDGDIREGEEELMCE